MKQRGVCVMIAFVLLYFVLTILYAIHGQGPEQDAGCKSQFGKEVDCE